MDRLEEHEIGYLEGIVARYGWAYHDYYSNADVSVDADDVKTLEKAIELIKDIPSAEPREVLYSGDGYADGYMVYDMAECPNCGYEYKDGDNDWGLSFCPNCGQKLNWESEG